MEIHVCVSSTAGLWSSLSKPARNATHRSGMDGRTDARTDGTGRGEETDAHAARTDRTPSGRSVRDAASHEVYFTSRGRVPRARLTSDERNGVAREVRGKEGGREIWAYHRAAARSSRRRRCSESSVGGEPETKENCVSLSLSLRGRRPEEVQFDSDGVGGKVLLRFLAKPQSKG